VTPENPGKRAVNDLLAALGARPLKEMMRSTLTSAGPKLRLVGGDEVEEDEET
jgi:hypothetical protein